MPQLVFPGVVHAGRAALHRHCRRRPGRSCGWLGVRLAALDVEEVLIPFTPARPTAAIAAVSPNGLVPYLEHDGARVWELTAILEYCAERAPLWPDERIARAHARAIVAEMHAGFAALRQSMWMNLGADFAGRGGTPGALADIARIEAIWDATCGASGTAAHSCSARRSAPRMPCSRRSSRGS